MRRTVFLSFLLCLIAVSSAFGYSFNVGGVPVALQGEKLFVDGKERKPTEFRWVVVDGVKVQYVVASKELYVEYKGREAKVAKLPKTSSDVVGKTITTRPGTAEDTLTIVYRVVTDKEVYEASQEVFADNYDGKTLPSILGQIKKHFNVGG